MQTTFAAQHDNSHPDCTGIDLEELGIHSNGTIFYRCKNCNHIITSNKAIH